MDSVAITLVSRRADMIDPWLMMPGNEVYQEARKIWPNREIGVILSLGTGMPRVLAVDNPSYLDQWFPKPWVQVLERWMPIRIIGSY